VLTDDQAGPLTFATSLSWDQLAAPEEARAGNELELRVDVHATLAGGAIDPPDHHRLATNQHQFRINRDEWARRLESFGASVSVPILVPLPIGDTGSRRGEPAGICRRLCGRSPTAGIRTQFARPGWR
jgi:hypothetical protein